MKTLPLYDRYQILKAGEINAYSFNSFKDDPKGMETVKKFRRDVELLLRDFDERWIKLCNGNIHELANWTENMRFVRSHLDEMDRQFMVENTRLFSWGAILYSMGILNAFRVAAEQVLDYNERDVVDA